MSWRDSAGFTAAPKATSEARRVTTTTTTTVGPTAHNSHVQSTSVAMPHTVGSAAAAASLASPAPEPDPRLDLDAFEPAPSGLAYSELHLRPATRTSVVTTTTTTTVHFAPILIPRSKPIRAAYSSFSRHPRQRTASSASASSRGEAVPPLTPRSAFASFVEQEERRPRNGRDALRLDPKMYPLSQSPWPAELRKLNLGLGNVDGEFYGDARDRRAEEERKLRETSSAAAGGESFPNDKGKGKTREDLAFPTTTGTATTAAVSSASYVSASMHARAPRSAPTSARRRVPRRARSQANAAGHGPDGMLDDVQDDDDEDDDDDDAASVADLLNRPRMAVDSLAIERGGRLPSPGPPPRKRPRAGTPERSLSPELDHPSYRDAALPTYTTGVGATGAVSHALPSPNQSPPSPVPTFVGEESQDCAKENDFEEDLDFAPRADDTLDHIDLGSGTALSGLLSLPDFVNTFDQFTPSLQSYFIYTFLKRSSIPVLQTVSNIIAPALRRDFLADLPPELGVHMLSFLDARSLCRASRVCKGWRRVIDGEWRVWKGRLEAEDLWVGDGSEEREVREIVTGVKENLFLKRWKAGVWNEIPRPGRWNGEEEDDILHVDGLFEPPTRRFSTSVKLASPSSSREASPFNFCGHYTHPFKTLYKRRFVMRRKWAESEPQRVSFPCHANNVVTCLQFDKDKIVSASDDHSINVFDTRTGDPRGSALKGHEGGVWALQYIGNILVSGSTDRTVRIWDLDKGKCTHVFVGHTSTVRCLQIVEPENINPDPHGEPIWEPPFPLIVTGSRDCSLRVWRLPSPSHDDEYHPTVPMSPTEEITDPAENPFHLRHLAGHRHAVRALAAHGKMLVSGSYDCHVRVWDMLTGECKQRLVGHSQKVYSVVLDHRRKQCASGSMDGTVRLWSTETGECRAVLDGHTSLVGLLGISQRNLVSAAADSTLRIWDPVTGECRHTLAAHSGAITCFQHDENKVISGSDGTLKMWDARDGTFTRDLLTGLTGVWQVSFDQRFCIAAVQRNGQSEFEILDFGTVDDDEDADSNAIKVEEEEDVFFAGGAVPSTSPVTQRPRQPPLFLRPGEFPRASPSAGVTAMAAGSAASTPAATAPTADVIRTVRRTVSSRNLQSVVTTRTTSVPNTASTSTLSVYRDRVNVASRPASDSLTRGNTSERLAVAASQSGPALDGIVPEDALSVDGGDWIYDGDHAAEDELMEYEEDEDDTAMPSVQDADEGPGGLTVSL